MITRTVDELNSHYLVMTADIPENDYQVPMLLANKIPGILPVSLQESDGVRELWFEITSLRPISEVFRARKITPEDMLRLFLSISDTAGEIDRFLLRNSGIVLDPDLVYQNEETSGIFFCYSPDPNLSSRESLGQLARFIVDHIDYDDRETTRLAYDLFQESMKDTVSLQDFTRLALESLDGKGGNKNRVNHDASPVTGTELAETSPEAQSGKSLPKRSGMDFGPELQPQGTFSGPEASELSADRTAVSPEDLDVEEYEKRFEQRREAAKKDRKRGKIRIRRKKSGRFRKAGEKTGSRGESGNPPDSGIMAQAFDGISGESAGIAQDPGGTEQGSEAMTPEPEGMTWDSAGFTQSQENTGNETGSAARETGGGNAEKRRTSVFLRLAGVCTGGQLLILAALEALSFYVHLDTISLVAAEVLLESLFSALLVRLFSGKGEGKRS